MDWQAYGGKMKQGTLDVTRIATIIAAAYVFLWVPDIDHAFITWLHHRSIITHSILPCVVFLALRNFWGREITAGALLGVSVHLSADTLSPAIGFGQIWLPYPVKMGLGPLSHVWLIANSLIGMIWALRLFQRSFGRRTFLFVMLPMTAMIGASYGYFNEQSIAAAAIAIAMLAVGLLATPLSHQALAYMDSPKRPN